MWWKICIAQSMGWEEAGCKYLFTLQQGLWQSYSCSDWCGYTTLQHRNTAVDKQQGLIFVQHTTAASPISYTPQWTESDRILSLEFETEKKQMNRNLTNFINLEVTWYFHSYCDQNDNKEKFHDTWDIAFFSGFPIFRCASIS